MNSQHETATISAVVPVYGCAGCVEALHERLQHVLKNCADEFEIVYIDDGNQDDTWDRLMHIASVDSRAVCVKLSRNYGQHAAITAGIAEAKGDIIIVLDCDLQDPPEEIPRMLEAHREGADVVLMKRRTRSDRWFRRLFSVCYWKLMSLLGDSVIGHEFGTLSLISRKVADAYLRFRDVNRHYLFIVMWLGFSRTDLFYERSERYSGESSYSLRRLVEHALQGVLFQSTKFLRWVVLCGAIVSMLGFLGTLHIIVRWYFYGAAPGWTSLAVSVWTMAGILMLLIGVVGLYVGQVFDQVKGRPLYVIDQIKSTSKGTELANRTGDDGDKHKSSSVVLDGE